MYTLSENNPNKTRFLEIWQTLTRGQRTYVVARAASKSKGAAAEAIGIKPATAYSWGEIVEEAADILREDMVSSVFEMRREALAKAMLIKIRGLDSDNEVIAQKAASEIIEWELGRANQPISGPNGGPILIAPAALPVAEDELAEWRRKQQRQLTDAQLSG